MKKGFTLIELLVVIAILGILATVALVSFNSAQMRSRDAKRKSDLKQVASALELYYGDYARYPVSIPWGAEFTDGKTIYFKEIPKDSAGGVNYVYRNPDSPANQKYQLFAHLENPQDINCLPDTTGKPNCKSPELPSGNAPNCGSGVCNYAVTSPNTSPTE